MFNAPDIILRIPDIAAIYEINDRQAVELDEVLEELDDNLSLDNMRESGIRAWEKVLKINAKDDDSLDDRRFRIKLKRLEKLPYSYRVILKKLSTLCPDGFSHEIDENRVKFSVKLGLTSKKMCEDVERLLDEILPLNMLYTVEILYNQHLKFKTMTHTQMKTYTHNQLRENVF